MNLDVEEKYYLRKVGAAFSDAIVKAKDQKEWQKLKDERKAYIEMCAKIFKVVV